MEWFSGKRYVYSRAWLRRGGVLLFFAEPSIFSDRAFR